MSQTIRKTLDNNPGKGLKWEVANGAITESALPSWKQIGATADLYKRCMDISDKWNGHVEYKETDQT
jgi:hypothetical protein